MGNFGAGRYAWELSQVLMWYEPVFIRGYPGLWQPPRVNGRIEDH